MDAFDQWLEADGQDPELARADDEDSERQHDLDCPFNLPGGSFWYCDC